MGKFHMGWFLASGIAVQGWNTPGYAASYDWTKPDIFQDGVRALERACFDYVIYEDKLLVPEAHRGSTETTLKYAQQVPKHDPVPLPRW